MKSFIYFGCLTAMILFSPSELTIKDAVFLYFLAKGLVGLDENFNMDKK